MAVKILDNNSFEHEILNQKGSAVVDFYAEWCGPCKMLAPVVEQIAKERSDIIVGKVNVEQNPKLVDKYSVMSVPTLVFFRDGKEYGRLVGYRPKEDILKMLM